MEQATRLSTLHLSRTVEYMAQTRQTMPKCPTTSSKEYGWARTQQQQNWGSQHELPEHDNQETGTTRELRQVALRYDQRVPMDTRCNSSSRPYANRNSKNKSNSSKTTDHHGDAAGRHTSKWESNEGDNPKRTKTTDLPLATAPALLRKRKRHSDISSRWTQPQQGHMN